ncbi:MAG: hypothetical protein ACOYM3_01070 [Terrimicrobiaceae bacterium]
MTRDEIQIVHEIGELSRIHAQNFKIVVEQRDTALQNAEMWKQRALRAEDFEHKTRAILAAAKHE